MTPLNEHLPALLPNDAASAVVELDHADVDQLPSLEAALIRRCVPARRREFAAGRQAARAALTIIGVQATEIGRAERGQPLWPRGITGSISHVGASAAHGGVAVAVVARRSPSLMSIGVDVEAVGAVDRELWPLLFTDSELAALRRHHEPELSAALAFSTKEAVFKAVYPVTAREIEFHWAEVCSAATGDTYVVLDGPHCGFVQNVSVPVRRTPCGSLAVSVALVGADVVSRLRPDATQDA